MGIYNKIFNNWQNFAKQEVEWFSTDTLESYETNCKNNSALMTQFDWVDKKFTYKFNSQGFRCEEFVDNSILFLGCSITQGIGMPVDNIFPTIVASKLNMPCINLGIERSSADTAFRLAKNFLDKVKPKICITTLVYPHRYELLTLRNAIHFIPNHKFQDQDSWSKTHYIDFYEKWIAQPENYELNYLKNILAINQLCDNLGIKFIDFSTIYGREKSSALMVNQNSKARDLVHPGVATHQIIADELLKVL